MSGETIEPITRRLCFDEALSALHHIRYDFTDEPAKAILYTLTERFQNTVKGESYLISYAGDGFFFLTCYGISAVHLAVHEINNGTCWCLHMSTRDERTNP